MISYCRFGASALASIVVAFFGLPVQGDDPRSDSPVASGARLESPRLASDNVSPAPTDVVLVNSKNAAEARLAAPPRAAEELARLAAERVESSIRDYRCIFLKRERIDGKLRDEEIIDVAFRDEPTSVYMVWRKNAGEAKRALYVDSKEWVDAKGRKLVRVEPAGAVARLFVAEAQIELHGAEARAASRRGMDEFGFKALIRLLRNYNDIARKNGVLDFRYEGEGVIDGRPTYVLVRRLPYKDEKGPYPDALMRMHIDQEWMIPTAVFSFADAEGKVLLASYIYTQVNLNPNLREADFKF